MIFLKIVAQTYRRIATTNLRRYFLIAVVLLIASLGHAQNAALSVTGEIKTPLELTLAELKAMPSAKVSAKDHDGTTVNYQGVPLYAILSRAGAPQGESLRGEDLRLCVLVKSADGYKVVFALAELDPLFTDRQVLVAYHRNGVELDAKAGPLRLVIPDEKRQGRWVRQVTELEMIRVDPAKKR